MDEIYRRTPLGRRWPSLGGQRMPFVDVLRGAAMLLVILSHAAALVDGHAVPRLPYLLLIRAANLASIAFVFVSGMMVSYFLESRRDRLAVVKRFARRAVFLAVAIHPATWLAAWFWSREPLVQMLHHWYITDTIAFCLVVGPPLMLLLGRRGRVAVVVGLLVSAVILRAFWSPGNYVLALLKELIVGQLIAAPHPIQVYNPLLQWLGVFLTGSVLGASLASAWPTRLGLEALGRRIARVGTVLVAIGAIAAVIYKLLRLIQPDLWSPALLEAVHPDRTTILFPAYVGALLWIFAWIIHRGHSPAGFGRMAWGTSVFGRTSLFAFVTQYAVVWSLSTLLGLRNHVTILTLWPLFAGFVAVIWAPCYVFARMTNRVGANDFETFARAVTVAKELRRPVSLAEPVKG